MKFKLFLTFVEFAMFMVAFLVPNEATPFYLFVSTLMTVEWVFEKEAKSCIEHIGITIYLILTCITILFCLVYGFVGKTNLQDDLLYEYFTPIMLVMIAFLIVGKITNYLFEEKNISNKGGSNNDQFNGSIGNGNVCIIYFTEHSSNLMDTSGVGENRNTEANKNLFVEINEIPFEKTE